MILRCYLLVCSNSPLKGMELWNLQFSEVLNTLLGQQDFTSGLPPASFKKPLPAAPLSSPPCGTTQRGQPKSKILKSSVGGTWANTQDFTWCVSSQVFRREKASKDLHQKTSLFQTNDISFCNWGTYCEWDIPRAARGGGDIAPWSTAFRNNSLGFKCFFVYEIRSTRPITNCLCYRAHSH